ncbi:T9SS type A sorting domain-containing protein [Epilithonimonas zeae]|uniref:T9SS type A sorting domain-containing protein n=1 Tax=Epilithonimonas zeae TaxID=1416779 RepID=UPI00200D6300|nr:T9SS type A sorting domain-containing protein [Epilithonimonas zeae]UQB67184.1 T9SS type A sorting domain-containing protein [Epilithonimonas zeae]
MKKILFSFAILATSIVFGQINLDKTFPSETLQVYTNASETYYYSAGSDLSTIKIYNSDYSLKKQFSLPVPSRVSEYYNFILSKKIFNTDDLLEIVVFSGSFPNVTIQIYNEDGLLVKDFGSGYLLDDEYDFTVYHDSTSGNNKLRLFKSATNSTEIYSLPSSSLTTKEIQSTNNRLSAFPNPSDRILNVINPKNGVNKVEVFDVSGKIVLNKVFNSSEDRIVLNIESLSKGNYIYKIGGLSSKFIKN